MGSRGGISKSTPPNGSIRRRIASNRFAGLPAFCASALRKICRASSSIERPCRAARTRNLRLSVSSRLRIVMLAITQTSAVIDVNVGFDCAPGKSAPASSFLAAPARIADADQARDEDGHVKLARDRLDHRRHARRGGERGDIAVSQGGQGGEAVIDEGAD